MGSGRVQDLRNTLLSLTDPGLCAPNPLSESLAQLTAGTRLSSRQPQALAHKKQGCKGVTQRLGGAVSSRESRVFLRISSVAGGLPVFWLGGGQGATLFGRPESGFIRHQPPPPCRPSSTPMRSKLVRALAAAWGAMEALSSPGPARRVPFPRRALGPYRAVRP